MSKVLVVVFMGMLFLFGVKFGGYVEGKIMPVKRDIVLTRIEEVEPGWVMVWGRWAPERHCTFLRIDWRIMSPSQHPETSVEVLEEIEVLLEGSREFGPWKIRATVDQIVHRSFATVVHRCHPFWSTRTHLFPVLLVDL